MPGRAAHVIFNFDFEHGVRRMRHERGMGSAHEGMCDSKVVRRTCTHDVTLAMYYYVVT